MENTYDDDEMVTFDVCPMCNTDYDIIDWGYQICSWCRYEVTMTDLEKLNSNLPTSRETSNE